MTALILTVLVFLVVGGWVAAKHNSFVAQINLVAESWRQVDVELRRRYELIPNLVRVVEAAAQYERSTLLALTAARSDAMAVREPPQRAAAEDNLGQAVRTVLVQAEAYPALRASGQFLALQHELVETEDRIAAARRLYNGNVRALNTSISTFPGSLIGQAMSLYPAQYFEAVGPQRLAPATYPTVGRP